MVPAPGEAARIPPRTAPATRRRTEPARWVRRLVSSTLETHRIARQDTERIVEGICANVSPRLTQMTEVLEQPIASTGAERHARWVRISHWVLALSLLTLAFSGFVILMAHPRLYWGEAGNDLTPALLELPISRNYKHGGWEKP